MNVLVTGATGFIGGRLVELLSEAGHTPVALTRHPAAALERAPALERAYAWEATQGPPPPEALEGIDAVVNLAGASVSGRWTRRKKHAIRESRIAGTRNLVEGVRLANPKPGVLVSASAIGYYGARGDERLAETSPPGSDFLSGVCQDWEREAEKAAALGLRVVRLRIGLVLAAGGGPLLMMLPLFRLGLGGRLGSGRQWWAWVHRDDLVGLILWAIENPKVDGPLNACAPEPARQREFARILGRVLERPAILPTPRFALRLVLGEFSQEILSGRRVVPERTRKLGYRFRFRTIEAALRDLLVVDEGPDGAG